MKKKKNCNIFILDSQYNLHKISGNNDLVFNFLYQADLFKEVNNKKDLEKEQRAINKLKSFYKTTLITLSNSIKQPPKLITTGRIKEAGCLFVNKPTKQVFYCQKPDDVFFYCDFKELKNTLKTQKGITNINNLVGCQTDKIKITHYPYTNKKTEHKFNYIDEVKDFLSDKTNYSQLIGHCFYMPIDWQNLGYEFKTYLGHNPSQFKQLAYDLVQSGISLNKKEQNIWCKQLISLIVQSHDFNLSKDEIKQDFFNSIKAYQEYNKITDQVNFNKNKKVKPKPRKML